MKMTLLEMTQKILSDMDSEDVNSISDTIEATQVASVIEDTYNNMVSARIIPEHKELLKLTALSDSAYPTHFQIPDSVKNFTTLWYDVSLDTDVEYRELKQLDPVSFMSLYTSGTKIADKNGGTFYYVANDKQPTYFTTFDDDYIVMDSHLSTEDTTLQASKIRAIGTVYPVFSQADTFTPDIDATLFPYLLAESKSICFSLFKSGSDPKIEQSARRLKSYIQNDQYRTLQQNKRPHYGR